MSRLSVNRFELLTQGKLYFQTKNAQNVFVIFMEKWKKKDNCYLVFGDKNIKHEEFLFFKQYKY